MSRIWNSYLPLSILLVIVISGASAQEKKKQEKKTTEEKKSTEQQVDLKDVPKAVIDAVKKRFPKGELTEGAKEEEDGKTIYEVSVKENGKNIDVSSTPDGKLTMIEKTIDQKELPKAVTDGVEKKYPKATYNLAESVTVVADGKETLSYYEVLVTAGDKKVELEVALDGSIKKEEDKTGEKDEEKAKKEKKNS